MRVLTACTDCKRPYDVSGMTVGSRFHCVCGTVLEVPAVKARDAAVVRCHACGGPREGDAKSCRYCGADFTLHDQNLQTICPNCMTRVSDKSRYCHYCATPIVTVAAAPKRSNYACPVCRGRRRLNSRAFGEPAVSMLECPRCAGIWLGQETFRAVVERAREQEGEEPDLSSLRGSNAPRDAAGSSREKLYRPCPVCSELMLRKNYARRSGVIVDICAEHGTWFDASELDRILRWIRDGGETVAARREQEERRAATMRERFRVEPKVPQGGTGLTGRSRSGGSGYARGDLIGELLGALFDV